MSESSQHRILVHALSREISTDHIWSAPPIVYCDIQDGTVLDVPPILRSHRPDVFARSPIDSIVVIGEAKTTSDVDTRHTSDQLASFFDYLRDLPYGELWIGVPWLAAGTAIRVSTCVRRKVAAEQVPVRVLAFMDGDTRIRRSWRE